MVASVPASSRPSNVTCQSSSSPSTTAASSTADTPSAANAVLRPNACIRARCPARWAASKSIQRAVDSSSIIPAYSNSPERGVPPGPLYDAV